MKKHTKFVTLLAVSAMCAMTLTAAVACSESEAPSAEAPDSVTGKVHVLYEGEPDSNFGAAGDLCFTAETGKIYRKNASGWVKTEFRDYTFENGTLHVTYPNGETGLFAVQEAEETEEHEHTFESAPVVIYESYCVIPGIGVKTCEICHESFAEIIPADPESHKADEENFGKCEFCGLLEDGTPGFEVKNDTELSEVFNQLEDGDTVVMNEDVTIADSSDLNISGKDITIDVKGNEVAIEKNKEESKGLCFDGGSLTITDSNATSEIGERGKFTLNVTEADNQSARDKGTYAMRVNNSDLTITNVDFEIINSTENNSHAMYVTGGKIDVESDAKIIVKQGKKTVDGTEKQTEGGYGIFLSEGAEMNLNATTVESEGPIFPFVVGNNTNGQEKTVLNINEGTVIHYHNSACSYGAIDVYPNGVVNMEEGSKIIVDGAVLDPTKASGSNYSNAMAFVVIGGGTVNMNGEIDLGVECGMAYAFFILNNYWYEDPEAELPSHIILDAHCTIGANAKIIATSAEVGGGVRFFAVQRNGTEKLIFSGNSIIGYSDLILKEGDAFYSVIIENGATITLNGDEVKKGIGAFAMTDSSYPGTGNANDHLGWFTSDAIKDMRVFGE